LASNDWQEISGRLVAALLPERAPDANKGTFGKCLVVAGSINYTGAAYLATSAAMRVGAGLTTLATAGDLLELFQIKLTESTFIPLPTDMGVIAARASTVVEKAIADRGYNVVLLGPGIGQEKETQSFVYRLLGIRREPTIAHPHPAQPMGFGSSHTADKKDEQKDEEQPGGLPQRMVLDADALNAVAALENQPWWEHLPAQTVMTPHPGELARLLGGNYTAQKVQADRAAALAEASGRFGHTIILKGAYTLIATADSKTVRHARSPYASALLATAGSGDVLAGIIGGLLAQGLDAHEAAIAAVHLHARAAQLGADSMGLTRAAGLLAGDLLMYIPLAMSELG
jgi:ADP-dependent NAD(P)H-hydrate dehydratase / NAD(P)H-hydrate epimerase